MDQNQLFGLKSTFKDQNRLLTRDNNIGRENTVDQNRLLRATSTRDLNSFKHFLGPKNKTLRNSRTHFPLIHITINFSLLNSINIISKNPWVIYLCVS